jgi:NitT/TauT family transport system ATP-binding protein
MQTTAAIGSSSRVGVAIQEVKRTFPGGVQALGGISLEIPHGQFIAIIGPSGCGKSTLLRLIAGLDSPTSGRIEIDKRQLPAAFVFQDAHLLPWRNVLHNVALPLELRHVPADERLDAARAVLAQVGLSDALERYPAQLSGGMRMRVSLARALVTNPNLLLLDEPFAALDEITRQRLDEQLRELWQKRAITVIFVTHSIPEATYLSQRVVVMSRRPGRVILDHPVALGEERSMRTRGEPAFARETRVLYEALEEAERT